MAYWRNLSAAVVLAATLLAGPALAEGDGLDIRLRFTPIPTPPPEAAPGELLPPPDQRPEALDFESSSPAPSPSPAPADAPTKEGETEESKGASSDATAPATPEDPLLPPPDPPKAGDGLFITGGSEEESKSAETGKGAATPAAATSDVAPSEAEAEFVTRIPPVRPTGNVNVGITNLSPFAHFHYPVSRTVTMGVRILVVGYPTGAADGTRRGWGALLATDVYTSELYRGLFLRFEGGLLVTRVSTTAGTGDMSSLLVGTSLGWRWQWNGRQPGNVGVAAGAFLSPQRSTLLPTSPTFFPGVTLDIGFTL